MTNVEIGAALIVVALLLAVVAFAASFAPAPARRPSPQTESPMTPPKKQTSRAVSRLAAKILRDKTYRPTIAEVRTLAASVLSQDETPPAKRASVAKGAKFTGAAVAASTGAKKRASAKRSARKSAPR